jgi:predicted dehydrogenase
MYRGFDAKGHPKETPLKGPRVVGHAALMRHFKECIAGRATPIAGPPEGITLMDMLAAIYKSAETQKSVSL